MKVLVYLGFIYFSFSFAAYATEGPSLADRYIAIAIQGDLRPAKTLLEEVDASSPVADRELAEQFRQRFIARSEPRLEASGNSLVDVIVNLYRQYWVHALLPAADEPDVTRTLEAALAESLRPYGASGMDHDYPHDPYAVLQQVLEAQGMRAVVEPALPLQDLLIWKSQTERQYEIELTDQTATVNVVFVSDFYSLGWKHYAALGLASTTGWVDNGILYCVEWAYATDTETFEVSYLKHEGRHLVDLERFPGLPAAELEYRAKLTELAFAGSTQRRLLDDFTAKSAVNRESPHAEANFRVTRDLWGELYGTPFPGGGQAWMGVSRDRVSRAARRLLERDTTRLTAPAHIAEASP
jgi:hypothetical protein